MFHEGQGLALGLEPADDLLGVHAGLDELQRNHSLDGLGLLSHPDRAHAAFADLLQKLVRTDDGAGDLGRLRLRDRGVPPSSDTLEEAADFGLSLQQAFHAAAELRVAATGLIEI